MTIILVLCVLGAASWLVLSVASRSSADPSDSVAGFSRALHALEHEPRHPRGRRAVRAGSAPRRRRSG